MIIASYGLAIFITIPDRIITKHQDRSWNGFGACSSFAARLGRVPMTRKIAQKRARIPSIGM
jgi:hypothetical protein